MKIQQVEKIMANEWFYKVIKHSIPPERTKNEVNGFISLCRKHQLFQSDFMHTNILDICCGDGRHSIELAKRGFNVIAIDISPFLIKRAETDLKRELESSNNIFFSDRRFSRYSSTGCII